MARKRLDLAVVHLTIEGIASLGGGVCTVTRGHLAALPRVRKALAKHGIELTPYFVETDFTEGYKSYDPHFLERAKRTIRAMKGDYYKVLNRSPSGLPISSNWPGGEDFFGTPEQIRLESAGAASIAKSIAQRHERTVVYCHDTFFMYSPVYGTLQGNDERIQWLRVVHSTTRKHDAEPVDPDKVGMEYASFYWACFYPNVYIGTISDYISRHLVEAYAADPSRIIPVRNGVDPLDKKFRQRTSKEIQEKIQACNQILKEEGKPQVPLDRPLILSFGRPAPYKRLHLTIEASKRLSPDFHGVIVTLGAYPELEAVAAKAGGSVSVINAFDFDLCAALSQHANTRVISILAYNEPFGLIPSEVRLLTRRTGGLLQVPSDGGGLAEQVSHGKDGFVVEQPEKDPGGLARSIRSIAALPSPAVRKIRKAGVERIFREGFTWSFRMLETLSHVVPEVSQIQKKVRSEVLSEEKRGL